MHTLPAAHQVGEQGKVVAFEPITTNLELLQKNLILNSFDDRVTVYRGAVSESKSDTVLMTDSDSDLVVDAAIVTEGTGSPVPNYRLDEIEECASDRLKLIKIDVEGAELSVLRSADSLLNERALSVVVEMHPGMMDAFEYSEDDLYVYMNSKGFRGTELSFRTPETYQVFFEKQGSDQGSGSCKKK